MRKSEFLRIIKKMIISNELNTSVEEISAKFDIPEEKCIELLKECGIDVVNECIEDYLNESNISIDDKKNKILGYLKKETSIKTIAQNMDLAELEVSGIIKELKEDGYNIFHIIRNGEEVAHNLGNESLRNQTIVEIPIKNEFSFLAISDTRLCYYSQQLSILSEIYKRGFEFGADFVLHLGDITEGIYTNNYLKDTVFAHDTMSQKEYVVNNYPSLPGMPTYFIIGDHDESHIKASSENIGKLISNERKDMNYIGQRRSVVKVGNTNILMRHPNGKVAYTMSYKSQRHINAMRSEDKVNIILNGHWCYMDEYVLRKIHQFSIPSIVATTPEMDFQDTPNTIGAYIINVKLDEKGNFLKTTNRKMVYYKTIKEDYRRIKPLILDEKSSEYEKMLIHRNEAKNV